MLKNVLLFAHHLLEETIAPGDLAIDATCGNGNDTVVLAKLTGQQGKVLAFDIQEQAIISTRERLEASEYTNVTLIQDSHAHVDHYLKNDEEISAAIFNLGYLPKSDKQIITTSSSTIPAVEKLLARLKKKGLVILVVYHGHEGGKEEKVELLEYVMGLDQKKYHVLKYDFINQINNPPFVLAIEKK